VGCGWNCKCFLWCLRNARKEPDSWGVCFDFGLLDFCVLWVFKYFFCGKQGLPTNPTTKGSSNSCLISGFCLHIYSINFYILNFAWVTYILGYVCLTLAYNPTIQVERFYFVFSFICLNNRRGMRQKTDSQLVGYVHFYYSNMLAVL
jgi:hypothetical protein